MDQIFGLYGGKVLDLPAPPASAASPQAPPKDDLVKFVSMA